MGNSRSGLELPKKSLIFFCYHFSRGSGTHLHKERELGTVHLMLARRGYEKSSDQKNSQDLEELGSDMNCLNILASNSKETK